MIDLLHDSPSGFMQCKCHRWHSGIGMYNTAYGKGGLKLLVGLIKLCMRVNGILWHAIPAVRANVINVFESEVPLPVHQRFFLLATC
jgi:hypothetical protein